MLNGFLAVTSSCYDNTKGKTERYAKDGAGEEM